MDLETARPRLPAITSLRFFAALYVVVFHLQAIRIYAGPDWFKKFASIGYAGVSFFFVLSGFILVYTYAGRKMTLTGFWRARFARVYPAYAVSLLVSAPFFFTAVLNPNNPFVTWPRAHLKLDCAMVLGLLQSWVPPAALSWNIVAWSLSVEAFFYLLFPILLLVFIRRSQPQLFLVAFASWLVTLTLSGSYVLLNPDHLTVMDSNVLGAFWMNAVKFHPLARLPEFVLGMASGCLFLQSRRESKLALPLVLSGMTTFVLVIYFSDRIPYPILHTALLSPAFAAIVYGFALRPKWGGILENRLLVLCGDASYSLYLLHVLILFNYFFTRAGEPRYRSLPGVLGYVLLAITISALVYRFIEEPSRRKLNPKRKAQIENVKTPLPQQPVPA
ncbi:MAG: acyltransferase [Candidatus Acidiferrum sp.]